MPFDSENVNLTSADPAEVICYLQLGSNEYDGRLGQRVAALFVILVVSTAGTFFPVIAVKMPKLRIPHYVYLFARYFGAGVIIATAFVQ
jgi:zinc transporter 1/2/3